MQIISDYTNDIRSEKKEPGSYEWWYFDGLSTDGKYGFTIIFYEGNPFSRRYLTSHSVNGGQQTLASRFPAISITIYDNGSPVYYSFNEHRPEDAEFSSEQVYGRTGKCAFSVEVSDEKLNYFLILEQELPNGDSISGNLTFTSSPIQLSGFSVGEGDFISEGEPHQWNLVQPSADVKGELIIEGFQKHHFEFAGQGYHDHNLGLEPMDESFVDWYWGRVHFDSMTLVYYIMKKKSGDQKQAWIIGKDGRLRSVDESIRLLDRSFSLFGLNSARKIELKGGGFECLIQKDSVIDNGPFYQRFLTRAILHDGSRVHQAQGISEYIYPKRIKSRVFWPLVNMRIIYQAEKAHWVQKSPKLYRWTW